jgi:hypothetical protein
VPDVRGAKSTRHRRGLLAAAVVIPPILDWLRRKSR